jgi:shikimate kinase
VISTGGSVIFGVDAMAHLKRIAHVVWLNVPLEELHRRIGDIVERGVIHQPGQTLADIFNEREYLYKRYADATLDCDNKSADALVRDLVEVVST